MLESNWKVVVVEIRLHLPSVSSTSSDSPAENIQPAAGKWTGFIGGKQRWTCCVGVDGRRTGFSSQDRTLDHFLLHIGHFLESPKVLSWDHPFLAR